MVRGDRHDHEAPAGSADTFLCLGPGWSSAANTPFRRHKTWVHEGGVATPLLVHWPNGITARGQLRTAVGHVIDLAPTILELAGADSGATPEDASAGPSPPGRSLTPTFAEDLPIERDFLWWLHDGHRALRQGDWKIVSSKESPWELYQMSVDRAETDDLSAKHPERVEAMSKVWRQTTDQFRQLAAGPP